MMAAAENALVTLLEISSNVNADPETRVRAAIAILDVDRFYADWPKEEREGNE